MSKVTLTNLKQYLKQRSQAELIEDIAELFSRLEPVKEYYQLKLSGGQSELELVEKYKAQVKKEFFPTRGYGNARLSIARKPIVEFKKLKPSPAALVDLMLYYVEMGVQYTNSYGDIDEPFYTSMETMYERALELITKNKLPELFEDRCRALVLNTRSIGWGFHDTLSDLYSEHFGNQA